MVTRFSLLLVATGLFAGMWSMDKADQRTAAEVRLARCASSPNLARDLSRPEKLRPQAEVTTQSSVPLPRGIAPGSYLIVDQTGATQRLTVPYEESLSSNFADVDQYMVRDGNRRWHFIRLSSPHVDQTARSSSVKHGAILK
jgi:hypothetical protein